MTAHGLESTPLCRAWNLKADETCPEDACGHFNAMCRSTSKVCALGPIHVGPRFDCRPGLRIHGSALIALLARGGAAEGRGEQLLAEESHKLGEHDHHEKPRASDGVAAPPPLPTGAVDWDEVVQRERAC